jgi:hypothetical protein
MSWHNPFKFYKFDLRIVATYRFRMRLPQCGAFSNFKTQGETAKVLQHKKVKSLQSSLFSPSKLAERGSVPSHSKLFFCKYCSKECTFLKLSKRLSNFLFITIKNKKWSLKVKGKHASFL